jgi:hypothetical protein
MGLAEYTVLAQMHQMRARDHSDNWLLALVHNRGCDHV